MMPRFFLTTGPCNPAKHFMLPAERRLPNMKRLVDQELYFVLHAARQTGKTTAMQAFAARLTGLGYAAIWATLEESQGVTDVVEAEPLWLNALARASDYHLPKDLACPPIGPFEAMAPGSRLAQFLKAWASQLSVPLVLLLDEADTVTGPAMVSLLRQLRAGFSNRGIGKFPVSIALIGMRDLRDYLTEAKDGKAVNLGSPFNIKATSLTLRNFNEEEVAELYAQHTAETGQRFEPEAIARAFYWSQGQPFLVNALAKIAVEDLVPEAEKPVTAEIIDIAKEQLIRSRTTHLDNLAERLKEPRVVRIVQAVLTGDSQIPYEHDDFQYVLDLGLIRKGGDGAEPANPLYREVLARQLTYNIQENLPRPRWQWQTPDGRLDFPALLNAFFKWWRQNADALVEDVPNYPEAIPHLACMAFLQRVINGGGTLHREYSAGRMALDLVVTYGPDRFVVEIKRVRQRDSLASVREAAIEQTLAYLDTVGENQGWVLIFDQHAGRTWEEKLWEETVEEGGKRLFMRGG